MFIKTCPAEENYENFVTIGCYVVLLFLQKYNMGLHLIAYSPLVRRK